MRHPKLLRSLFIAMLSMTAAILVGCDAESPTEPIQQQATPPPVSPPANAAYSISVSVSPDTYDIGTAIASQIEVRATRTSNGQPVPVNTTARLTTTFGTLSSTSGAGSTIPIQFQADGVARASLSGVAPLNPSVITIRAQIESSLGTDVVNIVEPVDVPFQLTGVSPNFGPPSGGTPITLFGTGFEGPVRVTFSVLGQNLVLADAQVRSSTRITATTPPVNLPAGQNATASILLENAFTSGGATQTDLLSSGFTYTRSGAGPTTLKIISLSPTAGPNEGGTQVTILGEGFTDSVQVYFTNGPLVEATVLEITPSRLEVITPAATGLNASNANSIVDVRVVDPVSGQSATSPGNFQYGFPDGAGLFISAIAPGQGEYLGGDRVTVFGSGFEEPVAVSLGGIGQQVISVTGTEIIVLTSGIALSGCSPATGPAEVVNIETGAGATGPDFAYFPVEPFITGLSTNIGAAGDVITIFGPPRAYRVGFIPPVRVQFGNVGVGASVSADFAELTVTVPPFDGEFTCGDDGFLEPESVDLEVINLDTGCSDVLTGGFTYDPGSVACDTGGGGGGGGTAPAASFTLETDADDGTLGATEIRVTDTSTGQYTLVRWDWTTDGSFDETSLPGQAVTHTYALPGTYTVTMEVVGASSDQTSLPADVN
ncbi:MAG: IPT/TIG domain-containing protein [Acidobacteriota bacterium]